MRQIRTGNAKFVKQLNRAGILHQLRGKGKMSRAELAKETELSRPCVSAIVDELIREGLVQEVGMGESKGGRKPILLEYNFRAYAVIGAVFEGSRLHMAIADLKGELLSSYRTRLSQPTDGVRAIRALEEGLDHLLWDSGIEKHRLLGMGVGLPGITQRRSGTVSYAPSTGWMGLSVRQAIEERLGIPVLIDNDVNLMTLGEYYQGSGQGVSHLVYLYVGTGIGAGIIIDGQLYRGGHEASGEVGYMMIGPVRRLSEGEYGLFEQNYAVPAIQLKAKEILPRYDEGESVVQQLVHQARLGDQASRDLLYDITKHWAYGMANIISVLDPERLILSGELVHMGEEGVKAFEASLTEWIPVVPEITLAALGEHAGMVGAVFSALESFAGENRMVEEPMR